MVQVPLYKSLVAMEVARVHDIEGFDTVHVPRFGDLSAATYTPGTTLTATDQEWDYDTIVISTYKHATFYVESRRTLGKTPLIKLRKLLGRLYEIISSEAKKLERSTTIIGVSY